MDNSKVKAIDGLLFEQIVESGARNLLKNIKRINDLNVFPIPDGDTGDNMYMTIKGGITALKGVEENSVDKKASALSRGMLMNARGNSGVILSQFFAGIADGLVGCETVEVGQFVNALKCGVCKAYKSVSRPVEGTILTVAREATDFVCGACGKDTTFGELLKDYVKEMKRSLDHTPDLLEALREAGVIDSGGAGLLCIAEGMEFAIEGKEVDVDGQSEFSTETVEEDFSSFNEKSRMTFAYCTELLLQLTCAKTNVEEFDVEKLREYLESVGDSVATVQTGTVVKLHVHTFTPDKVFTHCLQFGEFLKVKVENMTLQHNGQKTQKEEKPKKKIKARTDFALVTVATGEGLTKLFTDLGADEVIDGGQGKNPSIERFIEAFDDVNADNIFVLPNNGNIIMAAKQAAELYDKSNVIVVETKNIGDAYAILSMLDYSLGDANSIANQMRADMADVTTGMITTSIRDANIDGVEIHCGDYIGFSDKTMLTAGKDKVEVFCALTQKLSAEEKAFVIAVFGEGATSSDRQAVEQKVTALYPDVEYYEIDGGQEVYDIIVILE